MYVPPAECAAVGAVNPPTHWLARAGVFAELAKPRLTALAVLSALVGYYLAAGDRFGLAALLTVLVGAWLVGGGANALNQYLERDLDARMRRTARRPLPSGRLQPEEAFCFGSVMAAVGVGFLTVRVNPLTGLVALVTVVTYLFVYTPLKRSSPWSTVTGTVPGALPVLMGWAAAGREITPAAWALFGIVALWQLPHFFAIGWLHRDDYQTAGFPIWPVLDARGRITAGISALLCVLLLPLSMLPARWGLTGSMYPAFALVAGLAFVGTALVWTCSPSALTARAMFRASIAYLPLLLFFMVVDKL